MKKTHRWLSAFVSVALAFAVAGCQIDSDRHEHSFSKDWTSNATDHWHAATCEHTKEVSDKAKHTFGDWTVTKVATEEAEGSKERSCTVCEYKETEAIEKLAHTHKFATDWTSDSTNHWYAATCEHTTEVSGKAEHSFCDYVSNNDATTEADGTKTRECSVCGYKDTVTDEGSKIHVHIFAEEWTSDETYHWHSATCGHDVTDSKAAHSFGDWTVTKAATCTEKGSRKRICSVCKYEATEDISAKGHAYSEDWTSDATDHWHNCSGCKEVSGKTAHIFGEWTVTKAATCTEKGSRKHTCSVCKYEATEDISAKGHAYSEDWTSDATDHWHAATCEHTTEVSGKAKHNFGDWTVTKEASEFTVTLDSFDAAKKIPVIKAVREITGLGLGEAKALVEGAPKELKAGVSKADADAMIAKITEAGGKASKKEFSEKAIQERSCSVCGYKETNVHIHTYSET